MLTFDVNTEAYKVTKSAPAQGLDEELVEQIHNIALETWRALKFRDFGKVAATFCDLQSKRAVRVVARESSKQRASGSRT